MEFVIRGQRFNLSREEIEKRLKDVEPRGNSKYRVVIHGRKYPIKQVISQATGLPSIAFTTQDAYRLLSRLGFEIKQNA